MFISPVFPILFGRKNQNSREPFGAFSDFSLFLKVFFFIFQINGLFAGKMVNSAPTA